MKKVLFLIFMVILVLGATNVTWGSSKATTVYYAQVTISKGDTVWEISKNYNKGDMSLVEYVEYVKEFNDMKNDKIMVGQKIIVPYFQ